LKLEVRSQKSEVSGRNAPVVTGVSPVRVLILVVAAAVAFWGTRLAVCPKPARLPSYSPGQMAHLKDELGLDGRQAAALGALEKEMAGQLSDQCGRYCAVRAELGAALMTEGTHSVETSRRLVDQMCAIQAASELATLEHIRKVSALLNPDQRKQFLSNLTRCLCGGDGLCGGGCQEGKKP
jgi:hypothetical protein